MEKLQKISDNPLVDCPQCSEPELRKLVSAAAFRLKGSGWYETDFKTGSKKNVSKEPSGSSTSSNSSTSSDSGSASATSGNQSAST
jgi:putative FmdB family regulatory protein